MIDAGHVRKQWRQLSAFEHLTRSTKESRSVVEIFRGKFAVGFRRFPGNRCDIFHLEGALILLLSYALTIENYFILIQRRENVIANRAKINLNNQYLVRIINRYN